MWLNNGAVTVLGYKMELDCRSMNRQILASHESHGKKGTTIKLLIVGCVLLHIFVVSTCE